jgi:hypothetical protein
VLTRFHILGIVVVVTAVVLARHALGAMQGSGILWLVAVCIGGPWIVWYGAKQLYTAAKYGYVLTDIPERRVYRNDEPRLFRNNVIAWVVLFPLITAGAILALLEALKAQHIIG